MKKELEITAEFREAFVASFFRNQGLSWNGWDGKIIGKLRRDLYLTTLLESVFGNKTFVGEDNIRNIAIEEGRKFGALCGYIKVAYLDDDYE